MKKVLFLVMTCNHPFYKDALRVVEDTWAKDILDGSIPNAEFMVYTACDLEHPKECIDGHVAYVNVPDDLEHTWDKTVRAYRLIQTYKDFDVVFRTNTSTFVNPKLVINCVQSLGDDEVIAEWVGYYPIIGGERQFYCNMPTGYSTMMTRNLCGKVWLGAVVCPNLGHPNILWDDIRLGIILDRLNIQMRAIPRNNPDCLKFYAPCRYEDIQTYQNDIGIKYSWDPNLCRSELVVPIRSLYSDYEERRFEFDTMYQLYTIYKGSH